MQWATAWQGLGPRGRALLWNLIPGLILLLGGLAAFRRSRFAAVIAFVVLCRVPLVFLLAPVAQFKYYYSVYLGGIVLLGFALAGLPKESFASARAAVRSRLAHGRQAATG